MGESKAIWGSPNAGQFESGLKWDDLVFRERDQERLEEDYRFAQAGIQVELAMVQAIPKGFCASVQAANELIDSLAKLILQVCHHLPKGRRLVDKLGAPRKKNFVKETSNTRSALTAVAAEIFGAQRSGAGNQAKMFCMEVQTV